MLGIPHPDPTGPVRDDLWVIRDGMVDAFFVRTQDGVLAIDTGTHPAHMAREMRRLGLDPGAVTHVLLTHSDFDHVGGLSLFPKAPIYLGRDEVVLLELKISRRFGLVWNKPLLRPPTWVDDGFTLETGGRRIRAFAMPGHTPGSNAWIVDDRWLFVGDACTVNGGKADAVPWILYMDQARARESLRRAAGLQGIELLCTAHSGVVRDFAGVMGR